MQPPTTRPPRLGEMCTCGRPAATVYVTDELGDVGSCRDSGVSVLDKLTNESTDDRGAA